MKKLPKAFSWGQEHVLAVNHLLIPIAMIFAFWNGSNLEMKLKWKLHSLTHIGRITKTVRVRSSAATVLFHRSVPETWHNLPIQSWPTVYLRGSANNWIHRLWQRRISWAQKLATHSEWEICITERLLTFCCFPRGLLILEKTTWTTLNISQFLGEHTTHDASGSLPQSESCLLPMIWSYQLLLLQDRNTVKL